MTISEDLAWRGLIKDKTFEDINWLNEPRTFYLGIDAASSDSLTVGNLAVLILAGRLIRAGWKGILLAGGATSLIGDPGGKEEERQLISREEIKRNVEGIKSQIEKVLTGIPHELLNNLDWTQDYKYLDFLRDIGKLYSMTELMQRDFVAERIGEGGRGISYAEFSYSLLQGYDFWWLFKNKGVVLQIGASDQWGNMLSGVPLIRKKENAQVQAFSMPLVINKLTGRKFGKSEEGAVWLEATKTTPFQFYQFWINISDADVEEYLKVFSMLVKEEIENTMNEFRQNPAARQAQKVLAYEVTKIVHGQDQAEKQRHTTEVLFSGEGISELDESKLATVREEFPNQKVPANSSIIEALTSTNLAQSNSEARRLLESGAIYINGQQINRENFEPGDFQNGRLLMRRGKAFKDSALIELI